MATIAKMIWSVRYVSCSCHCLQTPVNTCSYGMTESSSAYPTATSMHLPHPPSLPISISIPHRFPLIDHLRRWPWSSSRRQDVELTVEADAAAQATSCPSLAQTLAAATSAYILPSTSVGGHGQARAGAHSFLTIVVSVSAEASIDLQIPVSSTPLPAAALVTSTPSRTSLPTAARAATPPLVPLRHGSSWRLVVSHSPSSFKTPAGLPKP